MHLFTPNHVQLLNSCYPPASALLTARPDYSPNSQELSRLTYYASNHPGKLTKLGSELEKRLKTECQKARAGNIRSRASLLITLAIFRAITTECRRDIALLSPALVASVDATLAALPTDLEVLARAANTFTAWTTYTDGHLIGTDSSMTKDYLSVLRQFSLLSSSAVADHEVRNRTRLIGFAALTGALNSEALYNDSIQFRAQVSTIMQPILTTLFQTDIATLDEGAAALKEATLSPYLEEFRKRPTIERRAASIHVHIDGDKGPLMADVANAALRGLFSLLGHANGVQLGFIMHSAFDSLDGSESWRDLAHCCWFSQKVAERSQYQYRYAVPTWLVERLCANQESITTPMHIALAAMATTVFNSPTPLVNLSTSDIISNLTTLLLRRIESDPDDTLLPAVVECISSLGRHVYYSDQIQDLAGELINRLVLVEVQGVLGHGKAGMAKGRTMAVRCLLAGLLGLIQASDRHGVENSQTSIAAAGPSHQETSKKDAGASERATRRTPVPPDIWQDTLSLICDKDHTIRADYCDALVFYLSEEMPKYGEFADVNGVKRARSFMEGPIQHAVNMNLLLHAGNFGTKFLHAIHAYLYILATTSSLGLSSSSSTSPVHSLLDGSPRVSLLPTTPEEQEQILEQGTGAQQTNGRPSITLTPGPRMGKQSVVQRLLDRTPTALSISASACLTDYALILKILTTVHEELPVRGLLTGIPMLVALDAATRVENSEDTTTLQRIDAIREVIANVWRVLGCVWNSAELIQMAEEVLASRPASLPTLPFTNIAVHLPARNPIEFLQDKPITLPRAGVNAEAAVTAIANSKSVHEATGLDRDALLRRFSAKWTADMALRDSVDRSTLYENTIRGDGVAPLLKISPALMHIENISQQSLARSARGVGVADLRGALEGRSSMSNPALTRPPSLSTLEHVPSTVEVGQLRLTQTRSRSRKKKRSTPTGAGEVRDVLNRLGIGKQNGSLLKASFPSFQKSDQRSPP
ncbi:Protein EFR3 [Hypsizygus marmoreus]|uniref:Protein EFR3 n=1 Tax=Hypsizygus marmoreus TaxID=39966 RepID=A0A369JK15_HYPMA|nr:Protein EFR3 [Hypsizygus marmoreus]